MSWFRKSPKKTAPPKPFAHSFDDLDALCVAAEKGDLEKLKSYFKDFPPEYFLSSLSAQYALVSACTGGSEAAVRYMLDSGVLVNTVIGTGKTPENAAAEAGHHHILLVLREYTIKAGMEPTELMEKAQALADAQKMLEMTKVVINAPVLQKDITVRDKPLKFKKPPSP